MVRNSNTVLQVSRKRKRMIATVLLYYYFFFHVINIIISFHSFNNLKKRCSLFDTALSTKVKERERKANREQLYRRIPTI
jgi:hypothetical protein